METPSSIEFHSIDDTIFQMETTLAGRSAFGFGAFGVVGFLPLDELFWGCWMGAFALLSELLDDFSCFNPDTLWAGTVLLV